MLMNDSTVLEICSFAVHFQSYFSYLDFQSCFTDFTRVSEGYGYYCYGVILSGEELLNCVLRYDFQC